MPSLGIVADGIARHHFRGAFVGAGLIESELIVKLVCPMRIVRGL